MAASEPLKAVSTSRLYAFALDGDDAALAQALKRGHLGAPAALFDRHSERLYNILSRLLGSDPALGDVLQESFIRALENIGKLRDDAKLKAWLTTIAVNRARKHLRRRARRRQTVEQRAVHDLPAAHAPPETVEAVRVAHQLLEMLSVDLRMAFVLRYVEGYELVEVAEMTGVSLATIKRRLSKARKRFDLLASREPCLEPWRRES